MLKFWMKNRESEKDLEARLTKEINSREGMAIKLTSQFHRGLPDRLVILPYRTIAFVELKSSGESPRPLQVVMLKQIEKMGFKCYVIDSSESLTSFLYKMDRRLSRIKSEISDEVTLLMTDPERRRKAQEAKESAVTKLALQQIDEDEI